MSLEKRCRATDASLSLGNGLDRGRLVFAEGKYDNLRCAPHRSYAEGQRHLWRIYHRAVEILCLYLPLLVGQQNGSRPALFGGSAFVKANLTLAAHTDNQQVQVARARFQFRTIGADIRHRLSAVGNVHILPCDIDLVQQLGKEPAVSALGRIIPYRVVFVN